MRSTYIATAAVALPMLLTAARGNELVVPANSFLVSEEVLQGVRLNVVDDKVAMSLAVEIHVQIELTEYALAQVHDPALRAHTAAKLDGYRRLFNTLDGLTDGRAGSMLGRPNGELVPQVHETAPARPRTARGGIGNVLQNTATKAILQVRLDIARQYLDLLKRELELAPPGEFDQCYIGIEVYNQMQVLAMLRVFESHASKDFAGVLSHATRASELHVDEARRIVEQFKNTLPLPIGGLPILNTADASGT